MNEGKSHMTSDSNSNSQAFSAHMASMTYFPSDFITSHMCNSVYNKTYEMQLHVLERLANVGKNNDFETSLQVLRGFDTDISSEVNDIKKSAASSGKSSSTVRFSELKKRRYYLPLMIGIGLLSLQQLCGINSVLFYSSKIFESAGEFFSQLYNLQMMQ
ncbi:unnamed protein product [Cuscuta campestris]|uniref:Uncharacterized protein n=1 Tax=Cuscuta campestris TaxID=132261 RepID=A0A484M7F4_9ASTE|nr:unnamed protein product [Cuscuta campestris]